MNLSIHHGYSDDSRRALAAVVQEIREQYLINGCSSQFWLLPKRFSNTTLTCQAIEKWLHFLAAEGVLYYYAPKNDFSFERDYAMTHGQLSDNHTWSPQMITPFVTEFTTDSFPAYALDIYDTNPEQLLENILRKQYFGNISKDGFDHYYYDNIPLTVINSSPLLKMLLEGFLKADKHVLTPQDIMNTLTDFNGKYAEDISKRNSCIYKIKKELYSVSQHRITIETSKSGRTVDLYELKVLK